MEEVGLGGLLNGWSVEVVNVSEGIVEGQERKEEGKEQSSVREGVGVLLNIVLILEGRESYVKVQILF